MEDILKMQMWENPVRFFIFELQNFIKCLYGGLSHFHNAFPGNYIRIYETAISLIYTTIFQSNIRGNIPSNVQ